MRNPSRLSPRSGCIQVSGTPHNKKRDGVASHVSLADGSDGAEPLTSYARDANGRISDKVEARNGLRRLRVHSVY